MGLWKMIIHGVTEGEGNVADHLNAVVNYLEAGGHTVTNAETLPMEPAPEPAPAPEPVVEPVPELPAEEPAPPEEAPAEAPA